MRGNKAVVFTAAVLAAVGLLISACGSAGYSDTPEQTAVVAAKATPTAEPTTATTNSTPEPTVSASPTTTAAPPTRLMIVAEAVRFAPPSLTATAGLVTIAFDNRDQGIPHNVHFFRGGDASGTSIASTEIQGGAVQQTLALGELQAGAYFYQCDVHPSQMMGTLTVS